MTALQLLGLDLLSTVAGTALLFGAAVLTLAGRVGSRSAGIGALACVGLAIPATAGRVAVVAVLAGDGWCGSWLTRCCSPCRWPWSRRRSRQWPAGRRSLARQPIRSMP